MAKYLDTSRKKCSSARYKLLSLYLEVMTKVNLNKIVKYQQEGVITRNIYVNYENSNTRQVRIQAGAQQPPPSPHREKEREEGTASDPVETDLISFFFTFCGNHYRNFKISSWLSPDPSPVQGASSPSPSLTKNPGSAPAHCSKVIKIWLKFQCHRVKKCSKEARFN